MMKPPFDLGQLISAAVQQMQTSPWYQVAAQARDRQHAVAMVIRNLAEMNQTEKLLNTPQYEPPFLGLLSTVALAEQILDARVEFFNDMKLPSKAKFNGKEREIVFYCTVCGKGDCPNADIGIVIDEAKPTESPK